MEVNLKKNETRNTLITILFSLTVILLCGISAFFLAKNFTTTMGQTENIAPKERTNNYSKTCKEREENHIENLFEGKLTKLNENLDLFKNNVNCTKDNSCEYYSAGVFKSGDFEGYTRVIALTKETGFLSPPYIDILLATKDFEKYILHVECDFEEPHNTYIKEDKIISQNSLPTEHPQNIYLDDNFALEFERPFYTGLVDFLHTFDDSMKRNRLNTESTSLEIFEVIPEKIELLSLTKTNNPKDIIKTRTYTLVQDSTGLTKWYNLKFTGSKEAYEGNLAIWEKKEKEREFFYRKPAYRQLGFNAKNIDKNNENINLYETYWNYLEAGKGYGGEIYALVISINIEELENIGYLYENIPLYRLSDSEHILNRFAYEVNIDHETNKSLEEHFYRRHLQEVPSLHEYSKKNPLLLFQDYWERWIVISESDFDVNFQ